MNGYGRAERQGLSRLPDRLFLSAQHPVVPHLPGPRRRPPQVRPPSSPSRTPGTAHPRRPGIPPVPVSPRENPGGSSAAHAPANPGTADSGRPRGVPAPSTATGVERSWSAPARLQPQLAPRLRRRAAKGRSWGPPARSSRSLASKRRSRTAGLVPHGSLCPVFWRQLWGCIPQQFPATRRTYRSPPFGNSAE
jgi:hypothetical protein